MKVVAQARVILLNDDPGRLLHGFGANAALQVENTGSLATQEPPPGNSTASRPNRSGVRGLGLSPGGGEGRPGSAGARGQRGSQRPTEASASQGIQT